MCLLQCVFAPIAIMRSLALFNASPLGSPRKNEPTSIVQFLSKELSVPVDGCLNSNCSNLGFTHTFHLPEKYGRMPVRFNVTNLFDQSYQLRDGARIGVFAAVWTVTRLFRRRQLDILTGPECPNLRRVRTEPHVLSNPSNFRSRGLFLLFCKVDKSVL